MITRIVLGAEGARAATGVFARNGYFNSKVADIARAAGVADGTVYLYFKSKEEILHSIFDQNMAEAIASGRKLITRLRDPREKLRRIALLHLERLGADRDLAVVFQVELRGSTKFMEEFSAAGFAEYLGLLRATFEEGQRAGVFRKDLNAKVVVSSCDYAQARFMLPLGTVVIDDVRHWIVQWSNPSFESYAILKPSTFTGAMLPVFEVGGGVCGAGED